MSDLVSAKNKNKIQLNNKLIITFLVKKKTFKMGQIHSKKTITEKRRRSFEKK